MTEPIFLKGPVTFLSAEKMNRFLQKDTLTDSLKPLILYRKRRGLRLPALQLLAWV